MENNSREKSINKKHIIDNEIEIPTWIRALYYFLINNDACTIIISKDLSEDSQFKAIVERSIKINKKIPGRKFTEPKN